MMDGEGGVLRRVTAPPKVVWAPPDALPVDVLCPNCGATGAKAQRLSVDVTLLHRARQVLRVVDCQSCDCSFYERPEQADYAEDEMLTRGRAALYLQQGAGLAQLFRPIARLSHPPGSRVLDIGCGFGFGLDFALAGQVEGGRHRGGKGWIGNGIDPALIAGLGRTLLGLPIEQRMLGEDEPQWHGACDVVMAAETIEHLPHPPSFLKILVATLAPGGVLVLTTPAAEALRPETPPGQLAGLLSPTLHIVIQSAASLRRLLTEAGLAHVHIERDGGALIAYASASTFALDQDPSAFRADYLAYLEGRATMFSAQDDLYWGFAGRALLEAVNDADFDRADRLRSGLALACQARFCIDLDAPALPCATANCSLEDMASLMPLNLASILYADAMLALARGASRPSQARRLAYASEAARVLSRAVGELAMGDALSEELCWIAAAESLLCDVADPADATIVQRLRAFPEAPGTQVIETAGGRRDLIIARAFVGLVNAGRHEMAVALVDGSGFLSASPSGLGRDAVFCRAILALQPGGDLERARSDFAWVRRDLAAVPQALPSDLFWAAVRGEWQALQRIEQFGSATILQSAMRRELAATGWQVPSDLAELTQTERAIPTWRRFCACFVSWRKRC